MSLNLVSPGVKVREVDLTVGRIDPVFDQVGGFVGPFAKGPVGEPVLIETEQDLLATFGKPSETDGQNEYWLTASAYLSYGGVLNVVRADSTSLVNSHVSVTDSAVAGLKITGTEDYENNHQYDTTWKFAARNPGSWADELKVAVIDNAADQRLGLGTFGLQVGYAVTVGVSTSYAGTDGTVKTFNGYLKSIITQINVGSVDVKILSKYDIDNDEWTEAEYTQSGLGRIIGGSNQYIQAFNNVGVADSLEKLRSTDGGTVSSGSTSIQFPSTFDLSILDENDFITSLNGTFTGRIHSVDSSNNIVYSDTASPVSLASTTIVFKYARSANDNTLDRGEGLLTDGGFTAIDWYEQQKITLASGDVFWKNIAPKPGTSNYAAERKTKNDELNIVVIDDKGSVSGVAGNILEKFTSLSKANDGRITPAQNVHYKTYLAQRSGYIFAGNQDTLLSPGFTSLGGYALQSGASIAWNQDATSVTFGVLGNKTYTFAHGADYGVTKFDVTLGDIMSGYEKFRNPSDVGVNYLINGPSGGDTIFESQAKINKLIDIANERKDCVVTASPHKGGVVNVTNPDTQTRNVIDFFDGCTSSSYAVFDSGYKYTFDRFNNKFLYIPLNGDIAGLMCRTSINSFPWFSPAGAQRGTINNAVKLAYNPSQTQRDLLYPQRINPVIFSPGAGIILFGDKTALSYASAFDRINVRRLFLTIESAIQRAARAQLFEFNDVITRTNFLNIVEPYLRDVQAKRGITEFLVVCDESNNTPDIVDANQFRADIFVKPARSINFIGLTFVANRTGVSFEEVVGTV